MNSLTNKFSLFLLLFCVLLSLVSCLPSNIETEDIPITNTQATISPTRVDTQTITIEPSLTTPTVSTPTTQSTVIDIVTPTVTAVPTETPRPTSTATTKPVFLNPPITQLAALNYCQDTDMARNYSVECKIEVYNSDSSNPVFRLSTDSISYESPAFSPDGQWLAYVKYDPSMGRRIHIVDTNWQIDEPLTDWLAPGDEMFIHSWSADNRWLAFSQVLRFEDGLSGPTYIVNTENRQLYEIGNGVTPLVWSLDEQDQFVFIVRGTSAEPDRIYIATPDDIENAEQITDPIGHSFISSLAWHPDGSALALCAGSDIASLWIFEMLSQTWEKNNEFDGICTLSWSPDGRWVEVVHKEKIFFYETELWQNTRVHIGTNKYDDEVSSWHISSGLWVGESFIYITRMNLTNVTRFEANITNPKSDNELMFWILEKEKEDGTRDSYIREVSWYFAITP